MLVLFAAVVAPALQIGFLLLIVLGVQHEPSPRWARELLRYHPTTRTWSMIEVMLIGVLVVLIKIADYATVVLGVALGDRTAPKIVPCIPRCSLVTSSPPHSSCSAKACRPHGGRSR